MTGYVHPDTLGRFWSKVAVGSPDECWPWTGARTRGYGAFWLGHRTVGAHVFSWIASNAEDAPRGLVIKHSCDNPPCVNPAHPSLGTVSENTKEAIERGLFTPPRRGPNLVCRNNHPMTSENVYESGGRRHCAPCKRVRERKYQDKRNARRRQRRAEAREQRAA